MPNLVELIEKDHRQVEALFSKFETTGDSSVAMTICEELDRHTTAEEKAVYPVVEAEVPDGKKLADEAVDEHKEARQLIGRIRRTEDPSHLAALLGELKQAIEHHVEEEESSSFRRRATRSGPSASTCSAVTSRWPKMASRPGVKK
jgi:hemerythrin superfamily protein